MPPSWCPGTLGRRPDRRAPGQRRPPVAATHRPKAVAWRAERPHRPGRSHLPVPDGEVPAIGLERASDWHYRSAAAIATMPR